MRIIISARHRRAQPIAKVCTNDYLNERTVTDVSSSAQAPLSFNYPISGAFT